MIFRFKDLQHFVNVSIQVLVRNVLLLLTVKVCADVQMV